MTQYVTPSSHHPRTAAYSTEHWAILFTTSQQWVKSPHRATRTSTLHCWPELDPLGPPDYYVICLLAVLHFCPVTPWSDLGLVRFLCGPTGLGLHLHTSNLCLPGAAFCMNPSAAAQTVLFFSGITCHTPRYRNEFSAVSKTPPPYSHLSTHSPEQLVGFPLLKDFL